MFFKKVLFICLMLYPLSPWHCFAVAPAPPSIASSAACTICTIERFSDLQKLGATLQNSPSPKLEMTFNTRNLAEEYHALSLTKTVKFLLQLRNDCNTFTEVLKKWSLEEVTVIIGQCMVDDALKVILPMAITSLNRAHLTTLSITASFSPKTPDSVIDALCQYIRNNQKLESLKIGFSIYEQGQINRLSEAIQYHANLRDISLDVLLNESSAKKFVGALISCGGPMEINERNTAHLLIKYFALCESAIRDRITVNGRKLDTFISAT